MMCDTFVKMSEREGSGFYLHEHEQLIEVLKNNSDKNIPTILIGVSFALIELAEKYSLPLRNIICMETGGMKGRREEITRDELHSLLKRAFQLEHIHSEYGMTELLSQAYSKKEGKFFTPPWMQILIRDTEDPFHFLEQGKTGCINIIDLANIHSCAFIATSDLGKINTDKSFEVLGRFDNSDIRGCNLLI